MRRGLLIGLTAVVVTGIAGVCTSDRALPGGRVQLLFTTRVNGAMAPCGCSAGQFGGVPRRATALERDRLRDAPSLLLDAGNWIGTRVPLSRLGFSDPYPYYELQSMALARSMAAVGYDAVNVGELDFKLGESFLREANGVLPLISANIVFANQASADAPPKPVFAPSITKTIGRGRVFGVPYGGLKVGIFGLVRTHAHVPRPDPKLGRDPNPVRVWQMAEAARAAAEALQADGCGLIIGLTQLSEQECADIARSIPALDVMIAGAERRPTAVGRQGGRAVAFSTEHEGRSLGEVVIRWRAGLPIEVDRYRQIKLDESFDSTASPSAKRVQHEIDTFRDELRAKHMAPDAPLAADPLYGTYVGSESCQGCHYPIYQHWEHADGEPLKHIEEELKPGEAIVATFHGSRSAFTRDIQDQGQHWNPACLRCHTTGYGREGGFISITRTPDRVGIGCEACHGPRSKHVAWQQWQSGKQDGAKPAEVPPAPEPRASTCQRCHDSKNSPNFQFWDYSKRITHPKAKQK